MRLALAVCLLAPSLAVADCISDAMLVFDASSSMAVTMIDPGRPSRIAEAREALRGVLPDLAAGRRMGLVTYGPGETTGCGHVILHLSPMARAAGPIMAEIDATRPEGNTPLTRAVIRAAKLLAGDRGGEVVLITDGAESCGGQTCAAAETIAAMRPTVTVHVIGFRLRQDLLGQSVDTFSSVPPGGGGAACLADRTGGLSLTTETIDELVIALRKTLGCGLGS